MSEYQFIHFLAIDRPLNAEQLRYMQRQSTCAEITPREFTNEYHFGDFRGNAVEMLRRGYDVHLHYANFGIRKLMFRLPTGLPCERKMFAAFCPEDGLTWRADKRSPGGILEIDPQGDADSFDELFEVDSLLHDLAPLRGMLIDGDLRPLYVAWLACRDDDEAMEPPVPAGLGKLTPPLKALAEFYEISEDLIGAAAKRSPPLPETRDFSVAVASWIAKQPEKSVRELAEQLLSSAGDEARAETLAQIRNQTPTAAWATAEPTRTYVQLAELSEEVRKVREQKQKRRADAAHSKRLKAIAADPSAVERRVEDLVKMRSTYCYRQAAEELAHLREALGPEDGPGNANRVAERLRRSNPTLRLLVSELRKKGLLD